MGNGSLGDFVGGIATGSADLAPELETGSTAIDYFPGFPADVLATIGKFLKNFGI